MATPRSDGAWSELRCRSPCTTSASSRWCGASSRSAWLPSRSGRRSSPGPDRPDAGALRDRVRARRTPAGEPAHRTGHQRANAGSSPEFPTVAELLALAVGAGEGPSPRSTESSRAQASSPPTWPWCSPTSAPALRVAPALDALARRSGLPVVSRFAEGMAVAIERGTPLAAVLHAQAGDVREAGRRALIESGARQEIAMMVPVVFLVLPVTVVFAFWPGSGRPPSRYSHDRHQRWKNRR